MEKLTVKYKIKHKNDSLEFDGYYGQLEPAWGELVECSFWIGFTRYDSFFKVVEVKDNIIIVENI